MKRVVAAVAFASVLIAGAAAIAKDKAPWGLSKGTVIAVVNLVDPEVMHYHAAKEYNDSFLKIQAVNWPVDTMLYDALKAKAGDMGLTVTPLAPSDPLVRARESCFVNAAIVKGLPKNCSSSLVELATTAGVSYLILMSPGLNNSDHAGSERLTGLSERLRGWGFITRERDGAKDPPTLFNEIELLLIEVTPGGATLRARQWGGGYRMHWQSYTAPADLKQIPPEQMDQLQPLFAAMLSRQAQDLLAQVNVLQ